MNTPSATSIKHLSFTAGDSTTYSSPKVLTLDDCTKRLDKSGALLSSCNTSVPKPNLNGLASRNLAGSSGEGFSTRKSGFGFNSFDTPVRQSDCSVISQTLAVSSIFDDAFDESILEEIDTLCDKPAAKPERDLSEGNPVENLCVEESSKETNNSFSPLVSNENVNENMLNSSGNQELGADDPGNYDSTLADSMPEEYAKYMKSLNDRQREAACSDISTPLMVIAGPGSGKVSSSLLVLHLNGLNLLCYIYFLFVF